MTLTKYRIECRSRRVRLERRRIVTPCGYTNDVFLSTRPTRCPICQNSYVRVRSLRETIEKDYTLLDALYKAVNHG